MKKNKNKVADKEEYLTPSELIDRHPELVKVWNNPQTLGYLLKLRLVDGWKLPRTCKLKESDVLRIFELTIKD